MVLRRGSPIAPKGRGQSCVRRGWAGSGVLFAPIRSGPSGVVIAEDSPDDEAAWRRLGPDAGRVPLAVPELLSSLAALAGEDPRAGEDEWPFVLSAGERRRLEIAPTLSLEPGFLLLDDPEVYRLPPDPEVVTRKFGSLWGPAGLAAGALVAGVATAFLGGDR